MALKVWLPLDESLENKGVSNLSTFSYNNFTQQTNGKIGKCYSGQGIYHLDEELIQNTWSLCAWVKSSAWSQYNDIILCKNTTAYDNCQFYFSIINGATLNLGVNAGSGSVSVGYTFATNTWYHVTATYDGTKYALYINGEQKKTGTLSTTLKTGMNNLGINCRSTNAAGTAQTGDGGKWLNDVRIYDHCLSAAEVKEIAQGLVLHYKLDTQYFKSGTNLVTDITKGGQTTKLTDGRLGVVTSGTNADTYFTINLSESITNGTTYHFSCDASGISEGQFWNFPLGAQNNTSLPCKIYNGHNEFVFTANDINWGTNRLFMDDLNRPDWEHPATFYNFILTKDAIYEVKDSSGYGHNGTINSMPTIFSETARYSTSTFFDGVDDCIIVPYNTICPENIFTFNLWFKKDALGSKNYETLFGGPSGFEMDTRAGSATSLSLYMAGARSSNRNTVTPMSLGNWYMITMTRDGTKEKYYVNGIYQSEINAVSMPTGTYRIGAWSSNTSQNYYGLISDFRIYCTALSADDILALYHTGAKVDNLQNLHTFEVKETNRNLLAGKVWTNGYSTHNSKTSPFTNFNSKGEYQFTANNASAGSEYIPINPTGHTYEYDYTISVNAGNQFYIGFERYDANKTSRSNNACVYTYSTKPSSDVVKQHFTGTVNLSTDGTNPCAFIALRILNGWSGTTSGVTGTATIHSFSLREIGTKQQPKLTKQGQLIEEEIKEETNTKLHKNGIVETNNLIEL